jgi:hypothetical protein
MNLQCAVLCVLISTGGQPVAAGTRSSRLTLRIAACVNGLQLVMTSMNCTQKQAWRHTTTAGRVAGFLHTCYCYVYCRLLSGLAGPRLRAGAPPSADFWVPSYLHTTAAFAWLSDKRVSNISCHTHACLAAAWPSMQASLPTGWATATSGSTDKC